MRRTFWARLSVGMALCGSLIVAACGDGDDAPPPISTNPPPTASGGNRPGGDGDGDGDEGDFNEPGSPDVELTLGDGTTSVFSSTIEALCTVAQSSDRDSLPPDVTSVRMRLFDSEMEEVASPTVDSGADAGEFLASFPVSSLEAGEYTVRCTAADTGMPSKVGMDELTIYVDRGPTIEVIAPASGAFLAATSLFNFEYRITPAPLFEDDDDAEIEGTPRVVIHGRTHDLSLKPGTEDIYWLEGFDLDAPANFDDGVPLGETLVSVRAENQREVRRTVSYSIVVDSTGPTVSITSPAFLSIIGNAVTFVFNIADDYSGVDWETLEVSLADATLHYETESGQWQRNGNSVSLTLQTREYAGTVELSINVHVMDMAGNAGIGAGSGTYRLDQHPPLISLDPPLFRARKGTAPTECSHAFDPVGSWAVDHGDDVPLQAFIRGVVWDQTNGDPASALLYFSSVSPSTVELWVAPAGANGVPLVVNSDGDAANTCDTIDKDAPGAQRVQVAAIAKKGTPFYGDGADDSSTPALAACNYKVPPAATHPNLLCSGVSDMHYVMPHAAGNGSIPAVFGFGVTSGNDLACNGTTFEVRSFVGQSYSGWVCAAMMAAVNVGNVGVSEPIAFCLHDPLGSPPACLGQGPAGAPDCTDSCVPAKFPANGIIVKDH